MDIQYVELYLSKCTLLLPITGNNQIYQSQHPRLPLPGYVLLNADVKAMCASIIAC